MVSELFATATTAAATLILPRAAAFERDGHITNFLGQTRALAMALPPPDGVLSEADMLVALADALSIALPAPSEVTHAATIPFEYDRMGSFVWGDERFVASAHHEAGDSSHHPSTELRLLLGAIFLPTA